MIIKTQARLRGTGLLLVALGLPAVPMPAASAESLAQPGSSQSMRRFDIPAQPLARALMSFGRQSGLQISVDSRLLGGSTAPAVKGEMHSEQALDSLLQGSGLVWRYSETGTVLLEPAPRAAASTVQLGSTYIRGQGQPYQGEMAIDRSKIEALPAGNGDITSLLKIHPNVQFDNKQLSSKSPGEISPAEISINGAQFYQNAFLVDGLSMNNDIDPAQEATPYRQFAAPGTSQGLALDTDLLDEIKVLDSNVSAAYGRFNGGVIEANTRKPSQELRGRVSAQMTRSAWTNYHIDPREAESFENASSYDEHPEFEKLTLRSTLEGHLTDDFGLLLDYTTKRSTIESMFYQSHNVASMGRATQDQRRQIDNWFLKAVWKANDRLDIESSITYAPEENHYFRSGIRGSEIDIQRGGIQFNLKANWMADWGRIEQTLGWNRLELSRTPEADDYMLWRRSTSKDWGVGNNTLEGEFGSVAQEQKGYQYRLDTQWNAFDWLGVSHRPRTGLEVAEQNVFYERLSESSTYVGPASTTTCTNSSGVTDTHTCAMGPTNHPTPWPGQFLTQRTRYAAGKFEFNTTSYALYAQNDMAVGRLTIRPGLRLDGDNYMDKTTLAPRLALSYDLFGDGETRLLAGANRYYGRNIASWRLQEGRNRLRFNGERRPTLNSPWSVGTQATNQVKFSQLDIAYDDELTFGIDQRWNDLEFGIKYVSRKGRDQVIQVRGDRLGQPATDPTLANNYTTWTNEGKSETDIITLTVTPLRSYNLFGTINSGQLALDWTDSKSSAPSYFDDGLGNMYVDDQVIQYEGKFIRYSDRPADNFNRPWTGRLTTITQVPQWNLTLSNFFRYRAAYSKVGDTGRNVIYQERSVDVWEERDYSAALTWDLRLGWEMPMGGTQAVFVNADVFNVTDKLVVADSTSVNSTGIPTYEVGRQYWLEVGYRF